MATIEPILEGRVAIVTGGARGLGRAMAIGLAEAGAKVVVAGNVEAQLTTLAEETRALPAPGAIGTVAADIRKPADCRRIVDFAVDAFGGLDILVNNAALLPSYAYPGRFLDGAEAPKFWTVTDDVVQSMSDTNFVAHERMTRLVVRRMIRRGWGRIVNVTTRLETMNRDGGSPYGATKAALEMASEVWTKDLRGTGVTVNILNPGGAADTEGFASAEERRLVSESGRITLMDPDRMKAPIVWLCSRQADDVTGMRYDAERWDPDRLPAEEAMRWGRPLGFELKPRP